MSAHKWKRQLQLTGVFFVFFLVWKYRGKNEILYVRTAETKVPFLKESKAN